MITTHRKKYIQESLSRMSLKINYSLLTSIELCKVWALCQQVRPMKDPLLCKWILIIASQKKSIEGHIDLTQTRSTWIAPLILMKIIEVSQTKKTWTCNTYNQCTTKLLNQMIKALIEFWNKIDKPQLKKKEIRTRSAYSN